jgi:hypothetical protein
MDSNSVGPAMRQKIFSMNLGVETVSLYLLCCAVADAGASNHPENRSRENGMTTWPHLNSRTTPAGEQKNILGSKNGDDGQGEPVYRMVDEKDNGNEDR